jgi:pimeloyl-ACP methyl ester carboxylesterase
MTNRRARGIFGILTALASLIVATPAAAASSATRTHITGELADGAAYVMDVPAGWNGTVLLFSHGINPAGLGNPNPAQNSIGTEDRQRLLDRGYALIGSSYAAEGWAIETAVPDQLDTLKVFTARFGKPRHTIAWGESMGGLVTTAIAERASSSIDGSLAMCGLEMGGVAEWNAALDSTFAFKILLAPKSRVPLTGIGSVPQAKAYLAELGLVADQAQGSAAGRARTALAAALYNIPTYNTVGQAKPAPGDWETAEQNQKQGLVEQVFQAQYLLRADAERWAGGNMSWNTGVDYTNLLARSANFREVVALYQKAHLSLTADLKTLARAPRIVAKPTSVTYMAKHSSFTGHLAKPQLNVHTTGDGLVPASSESTYRQAVQRSGRASLLRQAYVDAPGHCTFSTGEVVAAVDTIAHRVRTGAWPPTSAVAMNSRSIDQGHYVTYWPSAYLRPYNLTLHH